MKTLFASIFALAVLGAGVSSAAPFVGSHDLDHWHHHCHWHHHHRHCW